MQQQFITDKLKKTVNDSEATIMDINAAMEALAETKTDLHDDKPV